MIISDLNLLETVEATNVVGGKGFDIDAKAKFKKDVDTNVKSKIDSEVKSIVKIVGNAAIANAGADANGKNTFTETFTYGQVEEGKKSESVSQSTAATVGFRYYY
ncbi:hypothetical protein [Calothrix sp. UHCC 0171]|uniref:hypothetical protein n=1 Tax=Calothrix sp. UHCC 0171 TaxID=3110245 RepID=UPI002B20B2D3|nr:hypothetical protein [Calothrix sp. UHCC 0171]MEA5572993.1 hypothetical protein [Calothrix sp. UHCC 0171]